MIARLQVHSRPPVRLRVGDAEYLVDALGTYRRAAPKKPSSQAQKRARTNRRKS